MDWFTDALSGYDPGPLLGMEPLYRGPDDHWLYALPEFASYELPPPRRFPVPAADTRTARGDYQGVIPGEVTRIRITRGDAPGAATMYDDLYGDPLVREALGQKGSVDPNGPYAGYSGAVPVYNLSDASQAMFSPWRLPMIGLPALRNPLVQRATQAQPAPASSLMTYLVLGAAALAAVLLLRK